MLLPPGDNPIAVNKYILYICRYVIIIIIYLVFQRSIRVDIELVIR
jgi:hypothetical protein